jgi:uncharacterized protein (TIGR00369 family)
MTNFHGITHGGLVFALGDLAFAAAGNSRGQVAVALNVNICFLNPSKVGDRLVAEAKECHLGGPNGAIRNHGRRGKTGTSSPAARIWCIARSSGLWPKRNDAS